MFKASAITVQRWKKGASVKQPDEALTSSLGTYTADLE